MRKVPADTDYRHIHACRSADTSARVFFGHYNTGQGIKSGRGVTEQQLGHCQPLADLTPLNLHTGVASLSWVSFRGEVANSAPIIRSVPPQEINTSYL